MKTRKREIARAGIFGSVDNPVVVLEKDLQEIADTFPEIQKAPVQFGHWGDAAQPRLANVVAVTYDKEQKTLYGEIQEEDALAEAVDAGYYPDVSIGAKQRASDGRMYLHHLAYLGEEAPAIKDLKQEIKEGLGFAASDTAGVRMYPAPGTRMLRLSDGGEPHKEEGMGEKEELEKLKEENQKLKEEKQRQEKMLSDSIRARNEEELKVLRKACEGRLDQEHTEKLIALADGEMKAGVVIQLSDADGKKRDASPAAVLTEIMGCVPLRVKPGQVNLSDPDDGKPVEINFNAI